MKRIDTATADPNANGTGKAGYRDGVGSSTLAPTRLNASSLNHIQEEIARAIELSGETLDSGSYEQLFQAFQSLVRIQPVFSSLTLRASDSSHSGDALADVAFVTFGGPLGLGWFVAVGYAGVNMSLGFDACVWMSYDGVNWTKTIISDLGYLRCIASGNGVIVAGGNTTASRPVIATAPIDGSGPLTAQDISALAIADEANAVHDVCWSSVHNRFIAVGARSTPGLVLMYSNPTATAWTLSTPAASYLGELYQALSLGSRTVTFGELGEIQSSDDGGVTWTRRHSDPSLGTITSAVNANGVILANTAQARTMLRSADSGTTWAEVYSPTALEGAGIVDAVIEHVGRFDRMMFAVCKDATSDRRYIIGSLDGALTWKYVVRMPATDAAGLGTATIRGSATDSLRLAAVGTIGADVTAVAFSSSSAAIGVLE